MLTYWVFDEQSKQVLARSVVRPYYSNSRVKWNPVSVPSPKLLLIQGGDIKPSGDEINKRTSIIIDDYDAMEPKPVRHDINIRTQSVNPILWNPINPDYGLLYKLGKDKSVISLVESPTIYATKEDSYSGPLLLRYGNLELPEVGEITNFRKKKKVKQQDIKYPRKYFPPEVNIMEHRNRGALDTKTSKPIKEVKNKSPRWSRRVLGMDPAKFNKIFNVTTMALGIMFLPTHVTAAPRVPTLPHIVPPPLISDSFQFIMKDR